MQRLSLLSPAKVNLYLEVLNKRSDGFHNIVTLFERINLCDTLTFVENHSDKIQIQCNDSDVPISKKNLVFKVAELLRADFQIKSGVSIKIQKKIPVAAGLAGGSSNAATTILGLNKLWKLNLTDNQLRHYARKIGSDVAFFLYDKSWALGTQKGDKITPLKMPAKLWHILVVPRVKIYAKQAYGGLKLGLTKRNDNVNILIRHLKKNDVFRVNGLFKNDLEPVVIKLAPKLLLLKEKLKSLNIQEAMVSGSGPAVFGLIRDEGEGKRVKSILKKRFSRVYVVKTF